MKTIERILVVDDDDAFCNVMQRALTRRGLTADTFQNADSAISAMREFSYSKAIVDLKIAQDSGLILIKTLKTINIDIEIVMLTGYSSITTAVEAIKLGALNYFCKPVEVDELLQAFSQSFHHQEISVPSTRPSLERMEWEHIQKTLQDNDGNISATARILGMHRRTLQRKLHKRPVSN